jgi:hypothetical protein
MLLAVGTGAILLALLPCRAQAQVLPPPEPVLPPVEEKKGDKPVEEKKGDKPAVPIEPGCEERCPTGVRILWAETDVPCQSLVPREVVTLVKQPGFEIAYREEKRVVADVVIKPREVEHAVTCTVMKEVKTTDPVTGECSTVTQPCTEVRVVKETVYSAERQERPVVVLIPYLRRIDTVAPRKDLLLEYRTEMRKEGFPVRVAEDVPPPRVIHVTPPCETDHHGVIPE